ncbi:MAG: hypothetical protein HKP58_04975 [Desulfatitalea sp.]|nr:D-alanyl-D-alanine carboxypeptidase [Desulfatitalea sp.]NNJ99746.1 hypothetical protein [Desulfatitalea sp.]
MKRRTGGIVLLFMLVCGWHGIGHSDTRITATAGMLNRKLAAIAGPSDAVMAAGPDGHLICAVNADRLLIPASTLKVLIALAALHHLGPGYRFSTDFYLRSGDTLIIKGYGDPLLVSERIAHMAQVLSGKMEAIDALVLDDSFFAYPIVIPGRGRSNQPYDAPNGALCVNFNTVCFKQENGAWISAEPQTPLLSGVIPKIEASGLRQGRITLAANRNEGLQYVAALFRYFFNQAGIRTTNRLTFDPVDPSRDRLLWRSPSDKTVSDVIRDLLEFSNNFIANQLLLAMGAQVHGPPGTLDKGLNTLKDYYGETLGLKTGRIVEASGISRQNRMTARAMLTLLEAFAPHHGLMRRQGRQYYKTGHLKGIRTRAGYITAANGGLYRFVVLINTPGKSTARIMELLESELP